MRELLIGFILFQLSSVCFAGLDHCSKDEYASKRIQQIQEKRGYSSLVLTDAKEIQVGAFLLDSEGEPVDLILCGTYTNYFYVYLNFEDMMPEENQYKQFATVESASIVQDEALLSAYSYRGYGLESSKEGYVRIQVGFQYVNLADINIVEAGVFYMDLPDPDLNVE